MTMHSYSVSSTRPRTEEIPYTVTSAEAGAGDPRPAEESSLPRLMSMERRPASQCSSSPRSEPGQIGGGATQHVFLTYMF